MNLLAGALQAEGSRTLGATAAAVPGVVPGVDSQPSLRLLLLQSANRPLHAPAQVPAAQLGVMWLAEQRFPQPPQLLTSLLKGMEPQLPG